MIRNKATLLSVFLLTLLLSACGGGNDGDTQSTTTSLRISATAVSQDTIDLSWEDSSYPDGNFAGYNIYQDGKYRLTTTDRITSLDQLKEATRYCFTVSRIDTFGNELARSAESCTSTYRVVTIGFEPARLPGGGIALTSYQEQGVIFQSAGSDSFGGQNDAGLSLYPGSDGAYMDVSVLPAPGVYFQMANLASFNVLSIDLAEYSIYFNYPKDITFSCVKPDETSVEVTFTIDGNIQGPGHPEDFQTFNFPDTCTGLEYVDLVSTGFSFDNVKLAVPVE